MPINYQNYLTPNVTNTSTVYNPTAPGIQATLLSCILANTSSTTAVATVQLTSGLTTTNIIKNVNIPSGSSLNVIDANRLVIIQNNTLTVSSSVTVDVTLSTVEIT